MSRPLADRLASEWDSLQLLDVVGQWLEYDFGIETLGRQSQIQGLVGTVEATLVFYSRNDVRINSVEVRYYASPSGEVSHVAVFESAPGHEVQMFHLNTGMTVRHVVCGLMTTIVKVLCGEK